jgi:hypothetical protein
MATGWAGCQQHGADSEQDAYSGRAECQQPAGRCGVFVVVGIGVRPAYLPVGVLVCFTVGVLVVGVIGVVVGVVVEV